MNTLTSFTTPNVCVTLHEASETLWSYRLAGGTREHALAAPVFEVDGQAHVVRLRDLQPLGTPTPLAYGVTEYRFAGALIDDDTLTLELVFHAEDAGPVLRFHYLLRSSVARRLTKASGGDAISYLAFATQPGETVKEIKFSDFNEFVHSYCLVETELPARDFAAARAVMGPMLVATTPDYSMLLAYEHGSQVPNAFLHYQLQPEGAVALRAVKGNYYANQPLTPDAPYRTVWFEIAAVAGNEDALAHAYRTFMLQSMTPNTASRTPYIFYNTWAFQERNKHWYKHAYLDSMTEERMLHEIDVAHRMGIDVFVLDTGWYEKTGDWCVNTKRFSANLQNIKARLDSYGMKLGLWFSPTEAAVSSTILNDHRECIMSWQGETAKPHPVWESEESQHICLVSRYREAFADELIRLVKEVGVTYFKWDAISQYGCDDPQHQHGDAACSAQERADSYAFQLGQAMADVVNRVCAACPEAIVDFDVTEGGRCVGLGFLAAGKYFLINNGPYSFNYNLPDTYDGNVNLFFHPGPARGWVCRTPLNFDKWIPSVLFLTHYLPDDPEDNQLINIASLILGQNGIWGDLLNISEEGIARFGTLLGLYKQVRDDITAADPVRNGPVASAPEVHEKIAENGRGAVAIFASAAGRYSYVTQHVVDDAIWATDGATVTRDAAGRAVITATFDRPNAHIIYFGVRE